MKQQRPIVLLDLKGKKFTFEAAHKLLRDIEAEMPAKNAHCLGALQAHLGGQTLTELAQTVSAALAKGQENKVVHLDMNGSTNQLEAGLLDFVESLAAATKRAELNWKAARKLNREVVSFVERRPKKGTAPTAEAGLLHVLYHESDAAEHAARLKQGFEQYARARPNGRLIASLSLSLTASC